MQRKTSAWIYQRLNPLGMFGQTCLPPSFASLASLAVNELPDLGSTKASQAIDSTGVTDVGFRGDDKTDGGRSWLFTR